MCPICQTNLPDEVYGICESCHGKLSYLQPPFCQGCGGTVDGILDICSVCVNNPRPWRKAFSIFNFDGLVRDVVHRFKYNGNVALAPFLVKMIYSQMMAANDEQSYQKIVPVPLHWFKEFSRGYNQAELIAIELSRVTRIPYDNLLKRNKWTKPQARLDRRRRKKNLKNAFTLKKRIKKVPRSAFLLIDDVFTTGSTLEESAKILLSTGVEAIDVLTIAKG